MRKSVISLINKLNESQKLEEKRNPENDKANDLIRKSLSSDEFAKTHTTDLRKHGIKYIPPKKDWQGGALEGKQGRRLAVSSSDWRKNDVRDATNNSGTGYSTNAYSNNYSYKDSDADRDDLHQKTYATSKAAVKNAKKNIGRQTTKVANMEKKDKEAGIGWNEKTYKARDTLADYKRTLDRGVTSSYKDTDKIHPDADLKGFLNAKKHSDRALSREKDPKYQRYGGKVADPANKDVEDYKELKARKSDINREKEANKEYDARDQERIEDMKRQAKEDKKRRDSYVKSAEKEANKLDSRINSKLDAFRKRMNRQ